MANYSDVLDESTMALMSEIHQVHRGTNQQDVSKYVNSLMSLGRHLQLQEFRTWLNDKCGLPVAVRPSEVHLAEYMDKEQIEAWINDWTQNYATDRSGKMFRLFLQHEFQVDVKDSMHLCSGCSQPYSSFLLMPMRAYKTGTYDPQDYHLFCYMWPKTFGLQPHPASPGGIANSEPLVLTEDTSHQHGT